MNEKQESSKVKQDNLHWHKSLLKSLEDAGFPKDRAERAIIASGQKDAQTAIRWLKYHRDDPSVLEQPYRQFILFLSPKGPFCDNLNRFWSSSLKQCGRNAIHECFPHITLTRFFQVEDFRVPPLLDFLENITEKMLQRMPSLKLFPHKSKGYMALFLEESASNWLSDLVKSFSERVHASLGITAPIHSGQFHLTLAYQFDESKQNILEQLVKNIDLDLPSDWELQVFSRDVRTAKSRQFRAVVHPYAAESKGEISMIHGQHIILDNEQDGYKGWLKGTLHETGKSGLFPANYTERSLEWKCWTLHWSRKLLQDKQGERSVDARSYPTHEHVQLKAIPSDKGGKAAQPASMTGSTKHLENPLRSSGSVSMQKNVVQQASLSKANSLPRSFKKSKPHQQTPHQQTPHQQTPHLYKQPMQRALRRIFVIRHGERVDVTFGHSWITQFFDEKGSYHRRNLNMPKRLPNRSEGPQSFVQDSPITEIGACQARLTGESLFAHGINITRVFSSPAFRCIQTADAIMDALNIKGKVKIRKEPGLYEWLGWCKGKLPRWLSQEELLTFGINMDTKYEQFMTADNFQVTESTEQFYYRSHNVMKWILDHTGNGDENILIVGHSASLDACTRQLTGHPPRVPENFIKIVRKVPYCGVSVIEETKPGHWSLVQPPIPSLVHNGNSKTDWKMLLESDAKEPLAV
ncbi:ubiquitin-associated and SH3 domain-containing protein B-like [Rhopilema esculentum]|uniref:ubiquitin-associated and SH3 domain-containing protein B-like n=1 Tax=Rhopilema esculentum TaxID=499914 RepID=UPI0031D1E114